MGRGRPPRERDRLRRSSPSAIRRPRRAGRRPAVAGHGDAPLAVGEPAGAARRPTPDRRRLVDGGHPGRVRTRAGAGATGERGVGDRRRRGGLAIGPGLLVLLGVRRGDREAEADRIARKLLALRVFEDAEGRMNLSVGDVGGELLCVSQFTLYGDTRKGNRPSFVDAAPPEEAEPLYERVRDALDARGRRLRRPHGRRADQRRPGHAADRDVARWRTATSLLDENALHPARLREPVGLLSATLD